MPYIKVNKPIGVNYINISKPSDGGTIGVGYATGTLGLTYSDIIILTDWVNVSKPLGVSYTKIAKPTD